MSSYIDIFDLFDNFTPHKVMRKVLITKEAVHEEELMKADFVRLSWIDTDYYILKAGWSIIPFPDRQDINGEDIIYTLFNDYTPERTTNGYKYSPEFQNPKMYLGYVPYVFTTTDASNEKIIQTTFPYVGALSTLLDTVVSFLNELFPEPSVWSKEWANFQYVAMQGVDVSQTISLTFSETDVLSAIDSIAKTVGCEWHLDWASRILYLGTISLGADEYELVVGDNVSEPSITRSNDKSYTAYLVHGSNRNNTRKTENGNIAVNAPLTLKEADYPGSVIHVSDVIPVSDEGPVLTGFLTIDNIYPQYEMYIYDLVERKKLKKVDDNITNERYSIWYTKIARKVVESGEEKYFDFPLMMSDASFTVVKKHSAERVRMRVTQKETVYDDNGLISGFRIFLDRKFDERLFTTQPSADNTYKVLWNYTGSEITEVELKAYTYATLVFIIDVERALYIAVGDIIEFNKDSTIDGVTTSFDTRYFEMNTLYLDESFYLPYFSTPFDVGGFNYASLKLGGVSVIATAAKFPPDGVSEGVIAIEVSDISLYEEGAEIMITEGLDVTALPTGHVDTNYIDGLVPNIAFQINENPGHDDNSLGTREFEIVKYHTEAVSFDLDDDLPQQREGIDGGYYEIKYKTEGSDSLIVPTTVEQGICPHASHIPSVGNNGELSNDVKLNNKVTLFNIAMDDEAKSSAQDLLATEAGAQIAALMADQNNYSFKSNMVDFEKMSPNLYIGRKVKVTLEDSMQLTLSTRVLRLVTHLDYAFEQEITVGNKIVKGQMSKYRDELNALQGKLDGWVAGGTGEQKSVSGDPEEVDRGKWVYGQFYYYGSYNRDTKKIETSLVNNWFNAKWRCKRTLTKQEPLPGCTDWEMVEGPEAQLILQPSANANNISNGTVAEGETLNVLVRVMSANEDVTGRFSHRSVDRDDHDEDFLEEYTTDDGNLTFSVSYDNLFLRPFTTPGGHEGIRIVNKAVLTVTVSGSDGIPLTASITLTRSEKRITDLGEWDADTHYERVFDRVDDISARIIPSVWRYGILWQLNVPSATEAPSYGCTQWKPIGGDNRYYMEMPSSNGDKFYRGHVSTIITPIVYFGSEDISEKITGWSWQRSTEEGKSDEDTTWDGLDDHDTKRILNVGNSDMPTNWSRNNKTIFTCNAAMNDGVEDVIVTREMRL